MYLSISSTHSPATDLGYLLHKHPANLQKFKLSFGHAHLYYPESSIDRCTMVMLVDVDPVKLARSKGQRSAFSLQPYVNDRPYVASSMMSVAISRVLGSALAGRCKTHAELAKRPLPLSAKLAAVSCRRGEDFLRNLFEPLGYTVTIENHRLDPTRDWGNSNYFTLSINGNVRLQDLLAHLYVLAPVMDEDKHYWVDQDEIKKLLRHGEGWLPAHPLCETITHNYLARQRSLSKIAMAQLNPDSIDEQDELDPMQDAEEKAIEKPIRLHQFRLKTVFDELKRSGAERVLDLGCGSGQLLRLFLKDKQFVEILGMDVSHAALEKSERRLRLDRMPDRQRSRIKLIQGSLVYRDARLNGFDAAAAVEVIEHLEPERLAAFERVLFEFARPKIAIITTPNREYNGQWESLPAGSMRHRDHRFEWTRAEFSEWAQRVAKTFDYDLAIKPLGEEIDSIGSPSQMGVFKRK